MESPTFFILTSYASLIFAVIFATELLTKSGAFWQNIFNILLSGWAALLLSTLALTQIKWVNRAVDLPVVGVFLVGAAAYVYDNARSSTIQILSRHFPFAVSQLVEGIESGSRLIFSIEVAGLATVAIGLWYALLCMRSIRSSRRRNHSSDRWFWGASAGAISSLLLIAIFSTAASRSFGIDVVLVRAAYERDFTSNFRCDLVPKGAHVLLSKMSDTTGYAAKLSFPERPFFRMKSTDKDLAESMPLPNQSYRVVACNRTDP
ncbi:hypothetical protein [Burkholderia cepacia]|uniref:hypothetical protein n=1 Tax=Burkholderia cepacia TaxID=292 RepID=UPI0012D9F552|nr:hypothetical protein [Burkholderia cepacia]